MAVDNGQNSFRRGVMTLVLLSLLKKQDMYGYQLVQEIDKRSGGRLSTQEGSLYPVLYKLVDQGLISDNKVLVGRRMTRVYYHLEPSGEERLKELVQEYEELTRGVFLIIKEGDNDEENAACPVVSYDAVHESSGAVETEENGFIPNGRLCPGLCF